MGTASASPTARQAPLLLVLVQAVAVVTVTYPLLLRHPLHCQHLLLPLLLPRRLKGHSGLPLRICLPHLRLRQLAPTRQQQRQQQQQQEWETRALTPALALMALILPLLLLSPPPLRLLLLLRRSRTLLPLLPPVLLLPLPPPPLLPRALVAGIVCPTR